MSANDIDIIHEDEKQHRTNADAEKNDTGKDNDHDEEHEHDQVNAEQDDGGWKSRWLLLSALGILLLMLVLQFGFIYKLPFPADLLIYGTAYLLAGYNVLLLAFRKAKRFDFFNEFFLMSVATIGAFRIGALRGGVAG